MKIDQNILFVLKNELSKIQQQFNQATIDHQKQKNVVNDLEQNKDMQIMLRYEEISNNLKSVHSLIQTEMEKLKDQFFDPEKHEDLHHLIPNFFDLFINNVPKMIEMLKQMNDDKLKELKTQLHDFENEYNQTHDQKEINKNLTDLCFKINSNFYPNSNLFSSLLEIFDSLNKKIETNDFYKSQNIIFSIYKLIVEMCCNDLILTDNMLFFPSQKILKQVDDVNLDYYSLIENDNENIFHEPFYPGIKSKMMMFGKRVFLLFHMKYMIQFHYN